MTHHPHVHMIVPGGGISLDRSRWIAKRPDFFLPVRVLSKLFRRLMIEKLVAAHAAGQLTFYGAHAALVDATAFAAYLAPFKRTRWFVYAKRPFAGPKPVLAYLSRYTHRVAISNRTSDRGRCQGGDVQGQGLPDRRTWPLQDHDAPPPRVHPPLPDPRPAQRLSPHPPLRSAGERCEDRQPRAGPQAARRRSASARARACRVRPGHARYAVPVLWLSHAHHRGVRGRRTPAPQADHDAGHHQDRYIMRPISLTHRCCANRSSRSRSGRAHARPSLYSATPHRLKSPSSSRCRASRAASPAPRRLTITPLITSAVPTSAGIAPKSP